MANPLWKKRRAKALVTQTWQNTVFHRPLLGLNNGALLPYCTNNEWSKCNSTSESDLCLHWDESEHSSVNPLNGCVGGLIWWLSQEQNGVSLLQPVQSDGGTCQYIAHAGVKGGKEKRKRTQFPFFVCASVQYHMYAHCTVIHHFHC